MTISWGVITPVPTLSVTLSSARADSRCAGIALSELGVTCSHKSADRRIESAMSVDARTLPGLAIDFVTPSDHLAYLSAVGQLDVTLDTWPYSGGLTTIEALAMGVPSLTRSGQLFCERHTESHCFYAGMDLDVCFIDNFEGVVRKSHLARSLLAKKSPRLDHASLANELLFHFHVL